MYNSIQKYTPNPLNPPNSTLMFIEICHAPYAPNVKIKISVNFVICNAHMSYALKVINP